MQATDIAHSLPDRRIEQKTVVLMEEPDGLCVIPPLRFSNLRELPDALAEIALWLNISEELNVSTDWCARGGAADLTRSRIVVDAAILLDGIRQSLQTGTFEQPHMSGHAEDAETLIEAVCDYMDPEHCPHVIEGTVVRNIRLLLGSAVAIIRTSDKGTAGRTNGEGE